MIKPENVPENVWRAAMSAYHKTLRKNPAMAWQEAVVAMLNAWPEARLIRNALSDSPKYIKLPVEGWTQENENG